MPACRVCGLEVAEDQGSCPSCGAVQDPVVEMSIPPDRVDDGPLAADAPLDDDVSQVNTGEVGDKAAGATSTVPSSDTDGKRPGLKPLGEGQSLNSRYTILRKIGGGGMG